MSENSKIEWTDHTFNPWWGCMKVSEGCKNCYAETLDNRWKGGHWGPTADRRPMSDAYWSQPLVWNNAAKKVGVQAKVFCASMADVFEDHPQVTLHRARLFQLIDETPWLIWQLLTKRPENIMKFIPLHWAKGLPANVWIGTSVENQEAADERIPGLLQVPARVRFLSCEPLLGPVEISFMGTAPESWGYGYKAIYQLLDWVIAGGESGPHARPMHPDWARSLRNQCREAGVAFLFKQWGEWRPYDHSAGDNARSIGMFQDGAFRVGNIVSDNKRQSVHMARVGKKEAGRILDRRTHDEFPNK